VFLGHVKREKGVRELIEAAHGLGSRDLHIDVYGPLLDGTRVEDFTGNPRIRYRGTIPSERVSRVLRGYDVLVLPTYHPGEGYPGAILEAWAEDLPVITTRWRSLPEIVEHGVNGILVEPRDAEGLAGAILRLHADPDLMRVLRRGARASAEEFASRRWTRAFLEICRGATRGPSASESQLTRRSAGV
jgi:glycosyltransferase involved in cell wall biosynthesis